METLDLVRAIAAELGPDWAVETLDSVTFGATIRHDGPVALWISKDRSYQARDKGRVCVSLDFPQRNGRNTIARDWNVDCGAITCAASRGPAAIARDIERRILPALAAANATVRAAQTADAGAVAARDRAGDAFRALGFEIRAKEWSSEGPDGSVYAPGATIYPGGHVHLDRISFVAPDVAAAILLATTNAGAQIPYRVGADAAALGRAVGAFLSAIYGSDPWDAAQAALKDVAAARAEVSA